MIKSRNSRTEQAKTTLARQKSLFSFEKFAINDEKNQSTKVISCFQYENMQSKTEKSRSQDKKMQSTTDIAEHTHDEIQTETKICANSDDLSLSTRGFSSDDCQNCQDRIEITEFNVEKMQTGTKADDYDMKVLLLRAAFRHLSSSAWEAGGSERYSWVWEELDTLDRELGTISQSKLARRLRYLYKRLAYAKGKRGNRSKLTATLAATQTASKTNTQRGDTMPVYLEVPDEAPFKPGTYRAQIVSVEDREGKYGQCVLLTFEVTQDGKYKGRRLSKMLKPSLASTSKLGAIYRRLCGEPKPGAHVDLEADLVGQEVELMVKPEVRDGRTVNKVEDVFAVEEAAVVT